MNLVYGHLQDVEQDTLILWSSVSQILNRNNDTNEKGFVKIN